MSLINRQIASSDFLELISKIFEGKKTVLTLERNTGYGTPHFKGCYSVRADHLSSRPTKYETK